MTTHKRLAAKLAGALPAKGVDERGGAVIDTAILKRAITALGGTTMAKPAVKKPNPFAKRMADARAKKAPTKKGSKALATAKARVAKLEAAATKKAAISAAQKKIASARAELAKARGVKRRSK